MANKVSTNKDVTTTKSVSTRSKKSETRNVSTNKLYLLVTVVNRQKAEFYSDLIQSYDSNMQVITFGEGTASKEVLNSLGLTDSTKAIIFSVVREEKKKAVLASVEKKFNTIKNGKGIAFTISLSSVIGVQLFSFLSNNRNMVKEAN